LGLTGWYRKFIENYARTAIPLTDLTKWKADTWTAAHSEAVGTLKKAITTAPVLRIYNPEIATQLHTDSSDFALGGALVQLEHGDWRPVAFESRKMIPTERNYRPTSRNCWESYTV